MYTDASGYDGQLPLIAVYGWAFVAVDAQGNVVAEASGIVPSWVSSMSEAEAWALAKALQCSPPGAGYVTDCQAVLKQIDSGPTRATSYCKPMARVMRMVHGLLDGDIGAHPVVWMPSHRSATEVGCTRKSDGSELTAVDHMANDRADWLAKQRAKAVRADPATRAAIAARRVLTLKVASHIGRATWTANSNTDGRGKDSATVSSPARAAARLGLASARRRRSARETLGDERSFAVGGHLLVKNGSDGWRCAICWTSSKCRARIASQRCGGDVAAKWAERAQALAAAETTDLAGHELRITGPLTWCIRCGAYAEHHAVGLAAPCRGAPPRGGEFGRHTKLSRLRRGCHPKSGLPLAARAWATVVDMVEAARRDGLAAFHQHKGFTPHGDDPLADVHGQTQPQDGPAERPRADQLRHRAVQAQDHGQLPEVLPAALPPGGAVSCPGHSGDGQPAAKRQRADPRQDADARPAQLARPPTDAARRLTELYARVRARVAHPGPSSSTPSSSCCSQGATSATLSTSAPSSSSTASPSRSVRRRLDDYMEPPPAEPHHRAVALPAAGLAERLHPPIRAEDDVAPGTDLDQRAGHIDRHLPADPVPVGMCTRKDKAQTRPLAFVDRPPLKKPRAEITYAPADAGDDGPLQMMASLFWTAVLRSQAAITQTAADLWGLILLGNVIRHDLAPARRPEKSDVDAALNVTIY